MKSYINRFLICGALATMGLTSCVGDLDQLPADSRTLTPAEFKENPREYISGAMGKCYSGIAISGQGGAGESDISGLDNGRSCWSRAIFMLNEFPTDECSWIWKDSGVFDLVTATWGTNNENVFGTYSRLYCHIAICNDFIRLTRNLGTYDVPVGGEGEKAISQAEIDQFVLEARALRDLSYFYVIDIFGNAAYAWDSQVTGQEPPQMTRAELFNTVVADLEDVLTKFPSTTPVYGRIGKDAVEALLCKFYLNAEVYTGTAQWQKCWDHCKAIIDRHDVNDNHGLAKDYLSLFCANNDMFAPGGSLADQNESLWNIPYSYQLTESYGGSTFLLLASISDQTTATPEWYGINGQWTCMHARQQFSEKFHFKNGVSSDARTYLWMTDLDGFTITNNDFSTYKHGYVPVKFTNVNCNDDGTMPRWIDDATGLNRVGVKGNDDSSKNYGIAANATFANTDLPVIRLAEIYLTAAEAHLRGNVGDRETAMKYVNYIRSRAGVPTFGTSELTLANILDERCRELYWENNRRTDLVRYNQFTSGYTWNWKRNIPLGADLPSYMNLYPIPSQVINSYSSTYKQNEGYN
ncbi:MAG: RagB/SusD family nutrient uptake outer membrane protein [Clostridium sp.]|nr:RagB/SusD family nutrient uptake outer membrane protein [Prevotella sp.]MCM1428445.1 RagB/SusD family nutrient uptake outer membrane protein [Clostridium sp.]MCM1474910.1 RagB/SusD family nutrient uptake outer membrane protein [Muribaculaceae bacterium]